MPPGERVHTEVNRNNRTEVSQIRASGAGVRCGLGRTKDEGVAVRCWSGDATDVRPRWKIRGDSFRTLKREGNVNTTRRRFQVLPSAGCNDHVLAATDFIGDGRRIAGKRELGLPQQFSCGLVKRAKLLVIVRCTDEEESTRRHDWPAIIFAAGVRRTFGSKLGIFTQRNLPRVLAGVEVYCA